MHGCLDVLIVDVFVISCAEFAYSWSALPDATKFQLGLIEAPRRGYMLQHPVPLLRLEAAQQRACSIHVKAGNKPVGIISVFVLIASSIEEVLQPYYIVQSVAISRASIPDVAQFTCLVPDDRQSLPFMDQYTNRRTQSCLWNFDLETKVSLEQTHGQLSEGCQSKPSPYTNAHRLYLAASGSVKSNWPFCFKLFYFSHSIDRIV